MRDINSIMADARKYGHTVATAEEMSPFWDKVSQLANPLLKEISDRRNNNCIPVWVD